MSAAGITMKNADLVSEEPKPVEEVSIVQQSSLKGPIDKPSISGGVGVASGVLFLGAGKMLETNQIFDPRIMMSLDIRPHITVSNSLGFAALELAARNGRHETTDALMFIPSITIGKQMGNFRLAMRTSLDIAKLTFHEADYIKRSVGYTFGLRPSYCPTDNICIDGQMEVGILGSHSIFGSSFGLTYRR